MAFPHPVRPPGVMAIEHADFDGIERLALVLGGEIVSTFDRPEEVGGRGGQGWCGSGMGGTPNRRWKRCTGACEDRGMRMGSSVAREGWGLAPQIPGAAVHVGCLCRVEWGVVVGIPHGEPYHGQCAAVEGLAPVTAPRSTPYVVEAVSGTLGCAQAVSGTLGCAHAPTDSPCYSGEAGAVQADRGDHDWGGPPHPLLG